MYHLARVEIVQGIAELKCDALHVIGGERMFLQAVAQGVSLHIFHHDGKSQLRMCNQVYGLHDMRMGKGVGGVELPLQEPLPDGLLPTFLFQAFQNEELTTVAYSPHLGTPR